MNDGPPVLTQVWCKDARTRAHANGWVAVLVSAVQRHGGDRLIVGHALGGLWLLMGDAGHGDWVDYSAVTEGQETILFGSIAAHILDYDVMTYWLSLMRTLCRHNVVHRPAACELISNLIINTPSYDGKCIRGMAKVLGDFIRALEGLMLNEESLELLRDNRALVLRLQPYYRYAKASEFDHRHHYGSDAWKKTDVIYQKNCLGLNHMQLETIFVKLYRFGTLTDT